MNVPRRLRRTVAPLLTYALAASVIFAQQPKSAAPPFPPPKPAARESADGASVTLDTMFGADSYAVYGEMRSVGQYVSSEEFKQLLEPLRLPGSMPAEMTDLIDFFTAHAESLATARVAFGALPVSEGLPDVVAAVEMPSAEDAQKIEPQLRQFIAAYYAAHPDAAGDVETTRQGAKKTTATTRAATAGATSAPRANDGVAARAVGTRRAPSQPPQPQTVRAGERVASEAAAPYVIKRAGSVVALADKQFTFRRLRGAAASLALTNEPGFAAARARLATDTLFLYFNTTRMSRYTKRRAEEYERQIKEMEAEREAAIKNATPYSRTVNGPRQSSSVSVTIYTQPSAPTIEADPVLFPPDPREVPYGDPKSNSNTNSGAVMGTLGTSTNMNAAPLAPEQQAEREAVMAEARQMQARTEEMRRSADEIERYRKSQPGYEEERRRHEFENQLGRAVFSGDVAEGAWAESIGVGASLMGDELVARALFYSDSDTSMVRPIPFVPILLSGPLVAPEAASVVPADADIYVSASLDLPQMYDYVASVFKLFDMAAGAAGNTDKLGLFDSQISSFEKQGQFRIREDLLNSLGNEIGVVLPGEYLGARRPRKTAKPKPSSSTSDAQAKDVQAGTTAPIVVISLKDKKTVEGLLPRALEVAGLRGVDESQLFVKRGDVDVLAFGGGAAAFMGHFLVVSFDPRAMDWLIDSFNRGETLANSEEFRRTSGWQQRQLLGQAYVSNALLAETFGDVHASVDDLDDLALRNYVARLDANPGAITYSLTKDGASLFHELHVPKTLLALMSASSIVAQQTATMRSNEAMAMGMLSQLAAGERRAKEKGGAYVSLEEVPWAFAFVSREGARPQRPRLPKVEGYDIALTYSGDKFEITATPNGYPRQGRRSFYVDQTGVVRGGDNGGKPANADSDPVN